MAVSLTTRDVIFDAHCEAYSYFRAIENAQSTLLVDSAELPLEGPTTQYALEGPTVPRKRLEFDYNPTTDKIYAKFSIINNSDYECAFTVSCQPEMKYTVEPDKGMVSAGQSHEICIYMNELKYRGLEIEKDCFTIDLANISAERYQPFSFVKYHDRRILFASISQAAENRLDIVARQKSWLPWKSRSALRRFVGLLLSVVFVGLIIAFLNADLCDCFAREK